MSSIDHVLYNGNNKIISRLCNAVNWLIDHGGGGSEVTVTPTLTAGVNIAEITVGQEEYSLFAPSNSGIREIYNLTAANLLGYEIHMTNNTTGTEIIKTVSEIVETLTFYLPEPGTWIVSNTKNSDTITHIIDEVTETYGFVSLIPKLTTNVGDNGTAIAPASNPNYGNGNAFYAFDQSYSTHLEYYGENQSGAYIGYIFSNNVYISTINTWMGNYASTNNFNVILQVTTDGIVWDNIETFNVKGYQSGTYAEYNFIVNRMCLGFRFYSDTTKVSNTNWFTYEIEAIGASL